MNCVQWVFGYGESENEIRKESYVYKLLRGDHPLVFAGNVEPLTARLLGLLLNVNTRVTELLVPLVLKICFTNRLTPNLYGSWR